MKKTVLFILLFILLSGCEEVRQAKAYKIRQGENRKNDLHNAKMAEWGAMTATRLAAKKKLISVSVSAGIGLIVVFAISGSCYVVGVSVAKVRQANLMLIPLDRNTKQYPFIVAGGKQAYNPNTLASSDIWRNSLPYPDALRGSQGVQMIGSGEPRYKSYEEYEGKLLPG